MTELNHVCGALNEQVAGPFQTIWKTRASVGPYVQIPPHMWQVLVQRKLDEPGALGYHSTDKFNQPIAYVMWTRDYAATLAHEIMEMLADPSGNRMHGSRLPWG